MKEEIMPPDNHRDILIKLEQISASVDVLGSRIENLEKDTEGVLDTFGALQGGFKVLQWIGRLAVPVTAIGAAWASIKSGMWK